MKYTMQELKDIYREASARSESEDYEHIAGRVECVLKGETKCCRFQLFEKDLISACFVEDDDVCIVNGTYDEHVKRYGNHAELVMKMYGVKKAKAQTAETAVTETEQSEKAETVEQTEEQHITNTETVKSENVPHKTKTILVGKDAYFYLKNEQKKQRGCKPIYDDEKNNRFWEKQVTKFDGKARLGDDSFGGGDGTFDGRWWSWTVETLKAMLDKTGYSYEDGDEIEYLNV